MYHFCTKVCNKLVGLGLIFRDMRFGRLEFAKSDLTSRLRTVQSCCWGSWRWVDKLFDRLGNVWEVFLELWKLVAKKWEQLWWH